MHPGLFVYFQESESESLNCSFLDVMTVSLSFLYP